MSYLKLRNNIDSKEATSNIDIFLFNVNSMNYSKKDMTIIYGQVETLTYSAMDKLLNRAFNIEDFRTIDRLLNIYE